MKLRIHYDDELPINAYRWTPRTELEPMHFHDCLEIGLCVKGRGSFTCSDKTYPIETGDLFIVNNLEVHIAQADKIDPCELIFLNFDTSVLLLEDENLLMPFAYHAPHFSNRLAATSPAAGELAALVERTYREMDQKLEGYRSAAKGSLLLLCTGLLRLHASGMGELEWHRVARSFGKKRELLTFVQQHYRSPLELKSLADHLGLTESGASRAFRQTVGRSFHEQVNELRLTEAKRRLLSTDASVTDVCFASGFQSIASFYRVFHQATGMAPQDFRERNPVGAIFEPVG